jgi:hypothetical protein
MDESTVCVTSTYGNENNEDSTWSGEVCEEDGEGAERWAGMTYRDEPEVVGGVGADDGLFDEGRAIGLGRGLLSRPGLLGTNSGSYLDVAGCCTLRVVGTVGLVE